VHATVAGDGLIGEETIADEHLDKGGHLVWFPKSTDRQFCNEREGRSARDPITHLA
jgi:hypothetical protein